MSGEAFDYNRDLVTISRTDTNIVTCYTREELYKMIKAGIEQSIPQGETREVKSKRIWIPTSTGYIGGEVIIRLLTGEQVSLTDLYMSIIRLNNNELVLKNPEEHSI